MPEFEQSRARGSDHLQEVTEQQQNTRLSHTITTDTSIREQLQSEASADDSFFSQFLDAGPDADPNDQHQTMTTSTETSPEVFTPVERPPVSEDPRVQQLNTVLERFEQDEIDTSRELLQGSRRNLETTRREIDGCGVIAWASGYLGGLRETESVEERLVQRREGHLGEMEEARDQAREQMQDAIRLEERARELEQQGDLEGAQELFNQAQEGFQQVATTLGDASAAVINTSDIMRGLQSANETVGNSVTVLQNTETGLRIARDTTVIVGATVATCGVAAPAVAGCGLVAGSVVAVGTGTAVGTGIGAVANYTEAAGHVALGNMSAEDALSRANTQTLRDAQTAAISSTAALTGTGAANTVSRLGASTTVRIAAGASAGTAGATTSTAINTTIDYTQAVNEFNERYGHLPEAQRENVYQEFMEARGLTAEQIAWNSSINIATGTISGGIGGHGGAMREAAQSLRRAVVIESAEIATTAGVGLGMAYVRDGEITTQNVVQELQGAAVGFAQGRVTTRTPRPDAEVDTSRPISTEAGQEAQVRTSEPQQSETTTVPRPEEVTPRQETETAVPRTEDEIVVRQQAPENSPVPERYGPHLREDPLVQIHELIQHRNLSDINIEGPAPAQMIEGACNNSAGYAYMMLNRVHGIPAENLAVHSAAALTGRFETNQAPPGHVFLVVRNAHEFLGGPPRDVIFDPTASQFDGSPGTRNGMTQDANLMQFLRENGGAEGEQIISDLHWRGYVDLPHTPAGDHTMRLLVSGYRTCPENPSPGVLAVTRDALYEPSTRPDLTDASPAQLRQELENRPRTITFPGEEPDTRFSRSLSPEERANEIAAIANHEIAQYGIDELPAPVRTRYEQLTSGQLSGAERAAELAALQRLAAHYGDGLEMMAPLAAQRLQELSSGGS